MTAARRKTFLAIRHRPTGGLLPSVRGYGFTRAEPSLEEPPRLFIRASSATQALKYWLEGELYEGSIRDAEFGGDEISLRLVKRPDRRASEMEIVEVEVVVRSLDEAKLRLL